MYALILTSLLSLPIYPLNPQVQDTLESTNLHFTLGINGPNNIMAIGPELSFKYETLISHPYVVRLGVDYKFGRVDTKLYPAGTIHSFTSSLDGFYYRGTKATTGYFGMGIVYVHNVFRITEQSADSLEVNQGINEVSLRGSFGYRILMGLRINRSYSIEIGITEVRPKFIYTQQYDELRYSQHINRARMSDVRFTVGYLVPITLF